MGDAPSQACFDEATAARMVLRELAPSERDAHMSHADSCDRCLERLAQATRSLVSCGPEEDDEPEDDAGSGLPPGRLFGQRFVILDTLGSGGMGVVYLAHDTVLGREIALKVVRESHVRSPDTLRAEGRALAAIEHPNVVTVYDLVSDGDRLAIAMERVRGTSLRRRLRRGMRRGARVRLLLALGNGLAAAHEAGVVHGDVKLDNALVDADGRARLTDFGLARFAGTHDGPAGGTRIYQAPEANDSLPTRRSDQFAFAAMCVEALTGRRAATASEWLALSREVRPRWAWRPIARALAPEPDARHASLVAMLKRLRSWRALARALLAALLVLAVAGPWLAIAASERAAAASCLALRGGDLPTTLSMPPAVTFAGDLGLRASFAWERGRVAYDAWLHRVRALDAATCTDDARS